MQSTAIGPMESSCREVWLAWERFAVERLRRLRLASLLKRTDQMLAGLEELNLLDLPRVAGSWRWQLAALVADLPFAYQPPIGRLPSPTEAIEEVFEIQAGLLRLISGVDTEDDDERLRAAS